MGKNRVSRSEHRDAVVYRLSTYLRRSPVYTIDASVDSGAILFPVSPLRLEYMDPVRKAKLSKRMKDDLGSVRSRAGAPGEPNDASVLPLRRLSLSLRSGVVVPDE